VKQNIYKIQVFENKTKWNKLLGWGAGGANLGPCWILAWDADGNGTKTENDGPCWTFAWGVIGV